jgi:hypothetical protein
MQRIEKHIKGYLVLNGWLPKKRMEWWGKRGGHDSLQ